MHVKMKDDLLLKIVFGNDVDKWLKLDEEDRWDDLCISYIDLIYTIPTIIYDFHMVAAA